jgi:hypothetical protein
MQEEPGLSNDNGGKKWTYVEYADKVLFFNLFELAYINNIRGLHGDNSIHAWNKFTPPSDFYFSPSLPFSTQCLGFIMLSLYAHVVHLHPLPLQCPFLPPAPLLIPRQYLI